VEGGEACGEAAELLEGVCELLGGEERGEAGDIGEGDLPVGSSGEGEVFDAGVWGEVSEGACAFDGVEESAEAVDELVLEGALS
jgi:hypothetical protein